MAENQKRLSMKEAKEMLESSRNVTVMYGVLYDGKYVFHTVKKGTLVTPLIGGLLSVDPNTGESGIVNPINTDMSNYAKTAKKEAVCYDQKGQIFINMLK